MKVLTMIAALTLLSAGCMTTRGTGGSGIDLDAAHEACAQAAQARGWDDLSKLQDAKITSKTHARLTYDRSGFLKPDATCFYDARSDAASIE